MSFYQQDYRFVELLDELLDAYSKKDEELFNNVKMKAQRYREADELTENQMNNLLSIKYNTFIEKDW